MQALACWSLLVTVALAAPATSRPAIADTEKLGSVNFPVSCAPAVQAGFSRGVALLHDFWYAESGPQFARIATADHTCAMAHWGLAMSLFHQIWDRPDAGAMQAGWEEVQTAQALHAGTQRERDYIAALAAFYRPGDENFPARIEAYSAAMGRLYANYPDDADAGAFYALSLLAARPLGDTTQTWQRRAMDVLTPLYEKYPDNPGVLHYIIHACDNPAMARAGLAAANRYGQVAPSGSHAAHMPGHIYARLGLWPQDIASQQDSIAASKAAEARGENGVMDEPHSYDFLIYAYLQSGQERAAKAAMDAAAAPLHTIAARGMGSGSHMSSMVPYYRSKLPAFYTLETRDWKTAAAMQPAQDSTPEVSQLVYWARAIAHGHLRDAAGAQQDLNAYDAMTAELKKSEHAYYAEGNLPKIERAAMVAWAAFAAGNRQLALANMRAAADLQDKVGQQEVDIPAREMLADMLLEMGDASSAVAEYETALRLSPGRFNGLYGAGTAAEKAGQRQKAEKYYAELLRSTRDGAESSRPEIAHAKSYGSPAQRAGN